MEWAVTRLKIGFTLTMLLGAMWAAVGLFDSLTQVAVGLIVMASASIGLGAVQWVEDRRDDAWLYREAVWVRREQ